VTVNVLVLPVVSLAVLFLPGLVLGLLGGLRWWNAVAVAPLLTYGLTTATATLATYVHLTWNPVTLVLATALAALVVVAARLATGRGRPWRERLQVHRPRRPAWRDWLIAGGVLGGGLLSAGVVLAGMGNLGRPNQDYDYIFHANAVRLISDTGNVAPAALREINNWESSTFYYPNTFHALAALVRDLTGATVFEVLNAQMLIVSLVAGLTLACLLRRLGAPLAVVAVTPVLLAGFASFPYDILWRGPLLPYAAGIAVIPACLLLLDVLLGRPSPVLVLLFGLGAAGLVGLHPSDALSAAIFALVYLLVRWWRSVRTAPRDLALLVGAGVLALIASLPAVGGAITTSTLGPEVNWPAVETAGQAAGDLLFLDHGGSFPQVWLAGLVIVGGLSVHRARYMWAWLGGAAICSALFVMAASSDASIVETLTRPWWNDRWRFAALAVLGLAPLAAHGLLTLALFARRTLNRWSGRRVPVLRSAAAVGALVAAGLVVVIALSGGLYARTDAARMAWTFDNQNTLSRTEVAAMEWLAGHSDGGSIMNDANDGSAYLSAVAGLHPLFGHVVEPGSISAMGPTQQLLLEHFNCLDGDPAVRSAIERLGIKYVFLGSGFVRPDFHRLAGLEGIESSSSVRLVHSVPGVQIYAVDLTPRPTAPVAACTIGTVAG
jgi:hypothetical protein